MGADIVKKEGTRPVEAGGSPGLGFSYLSSHLRYHQSKL